MKVIFYCALFIYSKLLFGQTQQTNDVFYRTLDMDKKIFILGQEVLLYTQMDTLSELKGKLDLGSQVMILEKMDISLRCDGFNTNWYKILTANKDSAFIKGNALSIETVRSIANPSLFYAYHIASIKKVQRNNYMEDQILIKLCVFEEDKFLDALTIEAPGTIFTAAALKSKGNRGLPYVEDILEFSFNDGFCGGVSASYIVFWNGFELKKISLLSNSFDGRNYETSTMLFPWDKGGANRKIKTLKEFGVIEKDGKRFSRLCEEESWGWNGKDIFKIK